MADRPKLEIVRTDDGADEIYVNGKFLTDSTDSAATAAQRVARALGADIDITGDPTPQPYRYFITFNSFERVTWRHFWKVVANPGVVTAGAWFDLDKEIDSPADTQAIAARIAERFDTPTIVIITGFVYVDGPS
jgi:hypothetical protein